MKKTSYNEFLQEQLQDPELKREYDSVEVEFALAREIVSLRQQRNLTQRELAEKAGTSQPAIARVESGNYRNLSALVHSQACGGTRRRTRDTSAETGSLAQPCAATFVPCTTSHRRRRATRCAPPRCSTYARWPAPASRRAPTKQRSCAPWDEVAGATERLLDALVTSAPPRNREAEAAKARARAAQRFAPAAAAPS